MINGSLYDHLHVVEVNQLILLYKLFDYNEYMQSSTYNGQTGEVY